MTPGMILAKGFYWLCILIGGSVAMAVVGIIGLIITSMTYDMFRGE